jgi:hypothetical protein
MKLLNNKIKSQSFIASQEHDVKKLIKIGRKNGTISRNSIFFHSLYKATYLKFIKEKESSFLNYMQLYIIFYIISKRINHMLLRIKYVKNFNALAHVTSWILHIHININNIISNCPFIK